MALRFEDVIAAYRARGQKITPQRLAVVRALLGDATHPTASAVVERVRRDYPFVSTATVYRVLDELVEMGTILQLDLGNGRMRYDPNTTEHAHIVCEDCGRVEDVAWRLPDAALPVGMLHGYRISSARVVFSGRCPSCQGGRAEGASPGRVPGAAGTEGGDGGGSASPA